MADCSINNQCIISLRQTADKLLSESKLQQAQEALLAINKLFPNDEKLLIEIGDICLRLNNTFGAKYYYEKARRIDASNINIYSKLALLHQYQLNQPLKAEQFYQSIFVLDPKNSFAYFNVAKLYIKQHRNDDAQMAFKKCLEIDAHNTLYRNEYAKLLEILRPHKICQALSNEAKKRKQEWRQNSRALNVNLQSNECLYQKLCNNLLQQFVTSSRINAGMFDPTGNRCFCTICHRKRNDKKTYYRGDPSQIYVLPVGYCRFGIKLPSIFTGEESILDKWHVVYHGTKSTHLSSISESGLILLKPNDFKLNKTGKNKIRSGHIKSKFFRTNKFTNQKELFDPQQIFTSPSCIYASKYCNKIKINGWIVSFMFQCRQQPNTYGIGQETILIRCEDEIIDPCISNDCIEFYTKHNLNIVITGILIKIHNCAVSHSQVQVGSEEVKQSQMLSKCFSCCGSGLSERGCWSCNQKRECSKCKGSGICTFVKDCKTCCGTGWFGRDQDTKRCFKCDGSGTCMTSSACSDCVASKVMCRTCDGMGTFVVECRVCNGKGVCS